MKGNCFFLFFVLPLFFLAQERKEFRMGIETTGVMTIPMGDNYMAKGLDNFYGFGVGLDFIFVKNFGLGLEFNEVYGDVKDESVYGSFNNPRMRTISFFVVYDKPFNEKFASEFNLGGFYLRMKNNPPTQFTVDDYHESGNGFLIAGKIKYTIIENPKLQLILGPKLQFFNTENDYFEDQELNNFYTKATLLSLQAGLQINF